MKFIARILARHEGSLLKPVMTLMAGSVAAKLIGLAAIPVITRIYSPEQMGLLSAFVAVVAILSPLATLRYVMALPVPKTQNAAINLLLLNLLILGFTTALMALMAWIWGDRILSAISFSQLSPFLPFIVLGFFFTGLYEVANLWGTRARSYRLLAISQTWQALVGNFVKIASGLISAQALGLVLGQLVQQIFGIFPLMKICYSDIRGSTGSINFPRMRKLAGCFSDMPGYRLPSHILLMLAMQGPLLLTAKIYGMANAGQLGLALTALALPLALIGGAAGNAYFAEISALGRRQSQKILGITTDLTKKLLYLSLPPALMLLLLGPWMFSVVFGENWQMAGEYARVLSVYLVFQFISSPLGNVLTLYRRQDLLLKMNLSRIFMIVIVFYVAFSYEWESLSAIGAYSVLLSLHYFMSNRIIIGVIRKSAKEGSRL